VSILVTGGAGYIGSVTTELLLQQGHDVIVVDNLQEGHRHAVLPEAAFHQGDFGVSELLDRIFSHHPIEAVFHLAAETTIEFSMTDPDKYFANNLVRGITLLDTMRKYGCDRFIFSSTAATFGEPQYVPIDENHPQQPINAYGESKLMFERVLDWYHRAYGLKFIAFRYFNAAGATRRLGEDHRHESHLIPLVLRSAIEHLGGVEGSEAQRRNTEQTRSSSVQRSAASPHAIESSKQPRALQVFGSDYPTRDGTCVRDYVHVVDLARAHILGLENLDQHPNGKYNLGNGQGYTVLEVIQTASRVAGIDIPYDLAGRRPGDPAVLVASAELAEKELGWRPHYPDLETIIRSAWEWHLAHPEGYQD